MAATTTSLMTVEEFARLSEDCGPVYDELRQGEVIAVTRAKCRHYSIRRRLRLLLEQQVSPDGLVDTEFAFRPLPDSSFASPMWLTFHPNLQAVDPDDYVHREPDLVIEVLYPCNTAADMFEPERLCLENGAREFRFVDGDRRQGKVSTPDGHTRTWRCGQDIPLGLLGDARLAVESIFE